MGFNASACGGYGECRMLWRFSIGSHGALYVRGCYCGNESADNAGVWREYYCHASETQKPFRGVQKTWYFTCCFAGGMPSSEDIAFVKNYGGRVVTLTPSAMILKRLMRLGVDAFIIEGSEAGGHIGPVSTSVLAQEILLPFSQAKNDVKDAVEKDEKKVDTPLIFVAGGIGHGAMIAHYMSMGAVGCQMGTRFVCAQESPAHPAFKKAFIRASARDAVVSMQLDARLPVIPVRALKNKGMQRFMEKQKQVVEALEAEQKPLLDAQLEIEHFWAGALRRAVCDGDVENGSLMAGQSVGLIKREQPVKDIIGQLLQEVLCALG